LNTYVKTKVGVGSCQPLVALLDEMENELSTTACDTRRHCSGIS
jgi:hypothetical protein